MMVLCSGGVSLLGVVPAGGICGVGCGDSAAMGSEIVKVLPLPSID